MFRAPRTSAGGIHLVPAYCRLCGETTDKRIPHRVFTVYNQYIMEFYVLQFLSLRAIAISHSQLAEVYISRFLETYSFKSQNAMNFTSYTTPGPQTAYSTSYFNLLTFQRVSELDFPKICPRGSIIHFVFDAETPITSSGTLITPGEQIPHIDDLLPISRDMEKAFLTGARSVVVTLLVSGHAETRLYHFSKVRHLFPSVEATR